MIKINFKQPKYIFPLVIFVPLCALVYFVMQTFSGGEETAGTVATDRINMELPQANAEEAGDKMYEMSRRFGDEDAFTAVSGIGEEEQKKEELEHGYSEEELNRLDAAEAERQRQQQELEELERSLAESLSISIHMLTGTGLRKTVERVTEAWAIPHRTSLHVTLKRFSEGAMNGRRPLKADWVSKTRKQRKRKESTGLIP